MNNLEFLLNNEKYKSPISGIYGIILDGTNANIANNIQLAGMGFIYADNAAKANIKGLAVSETHVNPLLTNNSKVFISQLSYTKNSITHEQFEQNSFYNFPNTFPLTFQSTFQPSLPSSDVINAATGGRGL